MTRRVKPLPADENVVTVIPAPKIISLELVVRAEPLLAVEPLPDALAPASKGPDEASPLYSSTRMSAAGTEELKFTVTTLLRAAAPLMFGA